MTQPKIVRSEFFGDQVDEDSELHRTSKKHAGPFLIGKELGRGITGSVRLGSHADTGFKVALKIVRKKYLNKNPERWNTLRREIAVMKVTEHPNIVKLYDVFETQDKIYLVTELLTGGELFDYIPREGLPRPECLRILAQITSALLHCHEYGIVHRDLKPENLLMDEAHNVKLADFGMARLMKDGTMLKTSCGSPHYASPEVIADGKYDGKRSDVWSIGVILFAMASGMLPFDHQHIPTLLNMVKKGEYEMPDSLDDDIKDLIDNMIQVDLSKRIRMEDILRHAAFRKMNMVSPQMSPFHPYNSPIASPRYSPRNSSESPHSSPSSRASSSRVMDSDGDVRMIDYDLDETLLEDLLSLGWDSKEELRSKILQAEPSQEKSLYNHLKRRRRTRIEELHRLSPLPTRRRFFSVASTVSSAPTTPSSVGTSLRRLSCGPPLIDPLPPTGFLKIEDAEMIPIISQTPDKKMPRIQQLIDHRSSSVPSSPYSPPAFLTRNVSEPIKSSPPRVPHRDDPAEVSLKLFSLANSNESARPIMKPNCARLLFPTPKGSSRQPSHETPYSAPTESRRLPSIPDRVSTVILNPPKSTVLSSRWSPQKPREDAHPSPQNSPDSVATPISRWFSAFFRRRPSLDPWRYNGVAPPSGVFLKPVESSSPVLSSATPFSTSSAPSTSILLTPSSILPSSSSTSTPSYSSSIPFASPVSSTSTFSPPGSSSLSRERSSSLPDIFQTMPSPKLNSVDVGRYQYIPRKKEPRPSNRACSAYTKPFKEPSLETSKT